MSKFKFMHTLSESKGIFAIEQKVNVSCFVKNVGLLLGCPVYKLMNLHREVLRVPLDYPSLLFGPFGTRVSSLFCQNISLFFRSSICCSSVRFELSFNCSVMVISTSSKLVLNGVLGRKILSAFS